MFLNLTEQLVLEGKLQGSITGGKQVMASDSDFK
jgi:hypothetical protein